MSHPTSIAPAELKRRLIRLHNLERLHRELKERHDRLKEENRQLRAEVRSLQVIVAEQSQIITAQNLRIEELERMVFGRRRKQTERADEMRAGAPPSARVTRTADSYRRPVPDDADVTEERHHALDTCPDCGTPLSRIEETVFYEEDIILPPEAPQKTVAKHTVERGWCNHCRGWRSGYPLPSGTVMLGPKVRLFICYLAILIRLSFRQVREHLLTAYRFEVSDGEITRILEKEAVALRPEYEALKDRIRRQRGVHYDETSHPVQYEEHGNYAWVMTGTETDEVVFDCGKSRGKGVAAELKGESDHVGISDDYGAYRTLFMRHALCWAHPHRKLRDLAGSTMLAEAERAQYAAVFRSFAALYRKVRRVTRQPFDAASRSRSASRLGREFDRIATADPLDPPSLQKIKAHLRERKDRYFTCVLEEGIPADNNKAERALRHLVLKRKISFGSVTQKGAETLSILASVLLSLWRKGHADFFGELMALRGV